MSEVTFFLHVQVYFLWLFVGWVKRQKDSGFRCFNLILLISPDIQTTQVEFFRLRQYRQEVAGCQVYERQMASPIAF